MLYFANPSTPRVRDAMSSGQLGCIVTPAQGNRIPDRAICAADNGRFGKGWPGRDQFLAWLASLQPIASRFAFAVAPDVPFDMTGTLAYSAPYLPVIRSMGFPVALAAQNGLEAMVVPWDDFDVLFIGGDTPWKLGPGARSLAAQARERGKHVHMGRVNSLERLRYADHIGCDSADGTYLAFGPDLNLKRLLGWLRDVNLQEVLW